MIMQYTLIALIGLVGGLALAPSLRGALKRHNTRILINPWNPERGLEGAVEQEDAAFWDYFMSSERELGGSMGSYASISDDGDGGGGGSPGDSPGDGAGDEDGDEPGDGPGPDVPPDLPDDGDEPGDEPGDNFPGEPDKPGGPDGEGDGGEGDGDEDDGPDGDGLDGDGPEVDGPDVPPDDGDGGGGDGDGDGVGDGTDGEPVVRSPETEAPRK